MYGAWLYPFLDTSKDNAWEAYLALFAAHWVFYAATYVFVTMKYRVVGKLSCTAGSSSRSLTEQAQSGKSE
jgi:hypothetical protein